MKRVRLGTFHRNTIAANQRWKCNDCKTYLPPAFQIDHIIPLHQKGNNKLSNLQALCGTCHNQKTAFEQSLGSAAYWDRWETQTRKSRYFEPKYRLHFDLLPLSPR